MCRYVTTPFSLGWKTRATMTVRQPRHTASSLMSPPALNAQQSHDLGPVVPVAVRLCQGPPQRDEPAILHALVQVRAREALWDLNCNKDRAKQDNKVKSAISKINIMETSATIVSMALIGLVATQ